jgi:gluconolactonase
MLIGQYMSRVSLAVLLGAIGAAVGQTTSPSAASDPARDLVATAIPEVIAGGTQIRFVQGGLKGTEGVIAMPDGTPLFCEPDANRVYQIDSSGHFKPYLEDTNRTIGLAYDHKGRLIAAQSYEPKIAVLMPSRDVLVDSFGGQPLVRPNDLVIDKHNGIYFSDPLPSNPKAAFREPPPGRKGLLLYRRPDGKVITVADAVSEPHKITLSPDEKTFYAGDKDRVLAFDVSSDGSVRNPRTFTEVHGEELLVDSAVRV